jgi:hypothetical protein
MVEESKDGGPQGFERSVSGVRCLSVLPSFGRKNCVTAVKSVQSLEQYKIKVKYS